jgi:hypothetical protein
MSRQIKRMLAEGKKVYMPDRSTGEFVKVVGVEDTATENADAGNSGPRAITQQSTD